DIVPLPKDVAELLRKYIESKSSDLQLWPGNWPTVAAEMIRLDLEASGIPYRDSHGRVIDFHSLRHTFLSHLAEAKVHPKVAQILARHSTIAMTLDHYTHLDRLDVARDLEKLPPLPGIGAKKENPKNFRKKKSAS